MMELEGNYIIIDKAKKAVIYGKKGTPLLFNSEESADQVAIQFFDDVTEYLIVKIHLN